MTLQFISKNWFNRVKQHHYNVKDVRIDFRAAKNKHNIYVITDRPFMDILTKESEVNVEQGNFLSF